MDDEQALRGSLRQDSYVKERTAWVKAQREVTELKLAQMRGDLAPVPPIAASIASVAAAVKQTVLAQPAACAQACVGKAAPEIEVIFYEALRRAFEPFDEEHIGRIIETACEGFQDTPGAGAEAPASVQRKRVGRRRKKVKPRVKRESGGVAH